jgi:predicted Rossmann fold flavoprotein
MPGVIVIGGGPAGLMAAGSAAERGADVLLLERMPRPGRKLLLTGGGRCNLAHDCDARGLVMACGPRTRFLFNALGRFGPADTLAFFERHGLPIRREPDGRCFPASDRASDVLDMLLGFLREGHVQIRTGCCVTGIRRTPGGWEVVADRVSFPCRAIVLSTGGRSYPATGSSGDGYDLAASQGHRIVPARPAEVPLVAGPDWVLELAGLSLPRVGLRFEQGERSFACDGEMLFTHSGISGPAVLDASRVVAAWLDDGPVALRMDLFPDLTDDALDQALAAALAEHGRRTLPGALKSLLPVRLAERILPGSDRPAGAIGAAHRRAIARALRAVDLLVTGTRGFGEAVVTSGGVDLGGVEPVTMESRLAPRLFLAGEVLDLDGPRGGFNLQIAWTTGRVAGMAAAVAGSELVGD